MESRQVVVITGGSAGVGRATALAFAENDFDVAILARGAAGLQGAADEIVERGGRALVIQTDVSQFDQVDEAATRVENELGPIDVWVNDAMTTVFAPSWDVNPADFQRAVEVTFLGQVWGTMVALKRMRPRDRGSIVNVGSALAFIGIPLQAAYCSSKFACRGFFESTRAELLHQGSHIRMSMVHLPAVNTPQFDWCKTSLHRHPQPVPPIYQPEIPAKHILDAALTGRRSTVVGSWNKLLVLAGRLFPGLGNQYAAIGAWDTQLTSEPISADRPVNLYEPADMDHDHGAHGMFDDKAGGFLDPSFLKSLPTTARTFAIALARAVSERRELDTRSASRHAGNAIAQKIVKDPEAVFSPLSAASSRPSGNPRRAPKFEIPRSFTSDVTSRTGGRSPKASDAHVDLKHGPDVTGDALDLLSHEEELLRRIFEGWEASDPAKAEEPVYAAWDHGTITKLLIQQTAVHLAAKQDIARVLQQADQADLANEFIVRSNAELKALDHLDECCRGLPGIELTTPDIAEAVARLRLELYGQTNDEPEYTVSRLAEALGEHRRDLRSATYLRKHAPTHPRHRRWYDAIPAAGRAKVAFDRLSDFPGPSSAINDTKLVERYLKAT